MLIEQFKNQIPESRHAELQSWWSSLGKNLQLDLETFYTDGDPEISSTVENLKAELRDREERRIVACHIEDLSEYEFPNKDYYENLIGHEVILCMRGPDFHICKAHPELRLLLLLGLLPAEFECFISNHQCAMEQHLQHTGAGFWMLQHEPLETPAREAPSVT